MKNNNVCLFTGSRSEFGISKILIECFNNYNIKYSLIVSGSHLLKNFGKTYDEIKKYKVRKINKINLEDFRQILHQDLFSDSFLKYSKHLKRNKYKFAIIVGDRIEAFSFALACFFNEIKIIHFHGGELTQGSLDNYFRNMTSIISHYHFVSNNIYKKRLVNLGQEPKKIFNIGSLSLDKISKYKLLNKKTFCELKKIPNLKTILVTYHPLSNKKKTLEEISNIIKSCESFTNINFFFTSPSMDPNFEIINKTIKNSCKKNPNFYYFQSLGHYNYISVLKFSDLVIGNSSSAIIEAPFLKTPTINIGDRQFGREMSCSISNIRNVRFNKLTKMIKKLLSEKQRIKFQNKYSGKNPSKKFVDIFNKKIVKDKSNKIFYEHKNK